jgi:phosphate transport system permease protein
MNIGLIPSKYKGISDSKSNAERIFWGFNYFSIILVFLLLFLSVLTILIYSYPAIKHFGISMIFGKNWDPMNSSFGGASFILGTIITSVIALLISIPFSLALSLFLGQYYPNSIFSKFLQYSIDLLASIPSVIYGFWGLLILVPFVQSMEMKYNILPYGVGIFTASLLLSIMIIPYSVSLGSSIIKMVPNELKEAGIALGATNLEIVRHVVIPKSFAGIIAGIFLSFARALGETMAVTMVIGNSNNMPNSLFAPGNTLASLIANEFSEATGNEYISALVAMALILLLISTFFSVTGKMIVKRMEK